MLTLSYSTIENTTKEFYAKYEFKIKNKNFFYADLSKRGM